jgi:hypothetical protein
MGKTPHPNPQPPTPNPQPPTPTEKLFQQTLGRVCGKKFVGGVRSRSSGVSLDEKIFTPTDERGFLPYTPHPTPYTLFQVRSRSKLKQFPKKLQQTTTRELLETRWGLFVANHFIKGNVFFAGTIPRVIAFHALNR